MSTSPVGANKPIEDIEATLLTATKSALLVRLRNDNLFGSPETDGERALKGARTSGVG
jgi:hypothetical protein